MCMLVSVVLTVSALTLNIRRAVLTDRADAEAICAVRAPTQYVVEDGSESAAPQRALAPRDRCLGARQRWTQDRRGRELRVREGGRGRERGDACLLR